MMVTNMTASTSPASAGACVHEKLCNVPGCHGEMRVGRRLRPEHPAMRLRLAERPARQQQCNVSRRQRREQNARHDERTLRPAERKLQYDRDDDRSGDFAEHRDVREFCEIGEQQLLLGHDLHCAGDHQPSGRTEEAADDRERHKADRAPGMRESEDA